MARSVPTRSLTKSVGVAAASAGAARRRPAAQPPVAATSAATRSQLEHVTGGREHRRGLVAGEPQLLGAHLDEAALGAQPAPVDRWVAAARQHHADVRRSVAQERPQPVDGGRVGEVLRVVQHDRQRLGRRRAGRRRRPRGSPGRRPGRPVARGRAARCRRPPPGRRAARRAGSPRSPRPLSSMGESDTHTVCTGSVRSQSASSAVFPQPGRGADQHDVARAAPGRAGRAAARGRRARTAATGSQSVAAHRARTGGLLTADPRPHAPWG